MNFSFCRGLHVFVNLFIGSNFTKNKFLDVQTRRKVTLEYKTDINPSYNSIKPFLKFDKAKHILNIGLVGGLRKTLGAAINIHSCVIENTRLPVDRKYCDKFT